MLMITIYAEQKKRHRCIEQSFRLCGKRQGWDVSREQHQNVYYLGWNRAPAQVGCMRQALGPGALGRPRGIGWRGRWEGGSGWGTHVNPWLFNFNVWPNPLQYKKFKKKRKEKASLKVNIPKTNIMASSSITSWQIDGETMDTVTDFSFGGSKITEDGDWSHKIKIKSKSRAKKKL